jgi:hypothetical protein
MDGVLELTGLASKQSSQQRLAMKIRLLNVCFTDLHYGDFLNVNKRKTRTKLDRGDAGNSKHFYVSITDMANDSQNDDLVGQSSFPDDKHLSEAMTEGLDLKSFVVTTWTQGKKLLAEVFKEYQLANGKFTKSGSHEKDFFGDGWAGFRRRNPKSMRLITKSARDIIDPANNNRKDSSRSSMSERGRKCRIDAINNQVGTRHTKSARDIIDPANNNCNTS